MKIDTTKKGLLLAFKPYQVEVLKTIWDSPEGLHSGKIWEKVNEHEKISRASVTYFCNDMVDEGILKYHERSGKGGWHRVYEPNFPTLAEGIQFLKKKIINKLEDELVNI